MYYQELYGEIGKLLYAVADIDGMITRQEKERLLEIVKKKLVPAESLVDIYDTNIGYYTEFEFDVEDEFIADPETAFNSFIDFVEDHQTAFTKQMKKTCLLIAEEIAEAYRHTNKKEKKLLRQLREKLDAVKPWK